MSINRRSLLTGGMAGLMGLSLRSALLGVPVSFLVNRTVHAADISPKFTIFSGSLAGEPLNVSGPGTFAKKSSDLANVIIHPDPEQVGANITDVINGMPVNATDLAQGVDLSFGRQTHRTARAYQAMDQGFLNHFVSFWHQSGTNAHPEFRSVLEAHGALKRLNGSGPEQLPAAIAQENSDALGTILKTPLVLSGRYTQDGILLNTYAPTLVRSLISQQSRLPLSGNQLSIVYEQTLNRLYKDIKRDGTPQQKNFLDQSLISRSQARLLGEDLSVLLEGVDNSQIGQMRAAIALIKLKVAPVIIMRHDFGRDNHNDTNLKIETTNTFAALKSFVLYWDMIRQYNLTDQVLYTNMNVFGRTLGRNARGGRDHFGRFTNSFIHGTHLNGGVIGGMEPYKSVLQASGINSVTGQNYNPNIPGSDTLTSLHATLMAAAGIPDNRIAARIPDGRVVSALFD